MLSVTTIRSATGAAMELCALQMLMACTPIIRMPMATTISSLREADTLMACFIAAFMVKKVMLAELADNAAGKKAPASLLQRGRFAVYVARDSAAQVSPVIARDVHPRLRQCFPSWP